MGYLEVQKAQCSLELECLEPTFHLQSFSNEANHPILCLRFCTLVPIVKRIHITFNRFPACIMGSSPRVLRGF